MIRRRCYTCKCLDGESSIKFYERTKHDPTCRFYCRKCKPCHKEKIEKSSNTKDTVKTDIKERRRYSNLDKGRGLIRKVRPMKKESAFHAMSDQEKIAIGRFYRKRPEGCEIDHIIPLSKGGRHELSNLQYLSKEDHLKKMAKERTKKVKIEIYEMYPFTPIPQQDEEDQVRSEIRHKASKFKRVRRLVTKQML